MLVYHHPYNWQTKALEKVRKMSKMVIDKTALIEKRALPAKSGQNAQDRRGLRQRYGFSPRTGVDPGALRASPLCNGSTDIASPCGRGAANRTRYFIDAPTCVDSEVRAIQDTGCISHHRHPAAR